MVVDERLQEIQRLEAGKSARDEMAGRKQLPAKPAPAVTLYVAAGGKDSNPGTKDQPFASLKRARDQIRTEIGSDAYFGALVVPDSALLHPGRYFAGLAAAADRAGADLHERVRARTIRRQADGRFVVETERGAPGAALEAAIADLRYGTVCVNVWPGFAFATGTTPESFMDVVINIDPQRLGQAQGIAPTT